MAAFCSDCLNRMNKTNKSEKQYIISKHTELCEGCGELKRVVIAKRGNFFLRVFSYFMIPIKVVHYGILFLSDLFMPNHKNSKNNRC